MLWRRAAGGLGVEVALVHRPKYDDWSVPKGKLLTDEHPLVGALREVVEETGFTGPPGRLLGESRYLKDGSPKRVRYWSIEATEGSFVTNAEVDQVMWLPPREAASASQSRPRSAHCLGLRARRAGHDRVCGGAARQRGRAVVVRR